MCPTWDSNPETLRFERSPYASSGRRAERKVGGSNPYVVSDITVFKTDKRANCATFLAQGLGLEPRVTYRRSAFATFATPGPRRLRAALPLAARQGLEPRLTESDSVVLPITPAGIGAPPRAHLLREDWVNSILDRSESVLPNFEPGEGFEPPVRFPCLLTRQSPSSTGLTWRGVSFRPPAQPSPGIASQSVSNRWVSGLRADRHCRSSLHHSFFCMLPGRTRNRRGVCRIRTGDACLEGRCLEPLGEYPRAERAYTRRNRTA